MQLSFVAFPQDANKGKVELRDYTEECVQALLRYIYVGDIDVPSDLTIELEHLAERYYMLDKSCAKGHSHIMHLLWVFINDIPVL
jgi:hypothetical protein